MVSIVFATGEKFALSSNAASRSEYFRTLVDTSPGLARVEEPVTLYRDAATFGLVWLWLEGYSLVFDDLTTQELSNLVTDCIFYGIHELKDHVCRHIQRSTDSIESLVWKWSPSKTKPPLNVTVVPADAFQASRLGSDGLYDHGNARGRTAIWLRLHNVGVTVSLKFMEPLQHRAQGTLAIEYFFPQVDGDLQRTFTTGEQSLFEIEGKCCRLWEKMDVEQFVEQFPYAMGLYENRRLPMMASTVLVHVASAGGRNEVVATACRSAVGEMCKGLGGMRHPFPSQDFVYESRPTLGAARALQRPHG